jgi:membrane protease YdiL (CAAX protease family)
VLYHAAEYNIVFKNNVIGFFAFQIIFFVIALLLGNWYSLNGLTAWGLPFSKSIFTLLLYGIILGIVVYAVPYLISITFGIEKMVHVPDRAAILKASVPFAFGVLFSSLSEDVLTRGIIYACFNNKMKPGWLILISATIYLLNHIYRLDDGIESLLYIFLLGIVFIVPVIHTKNLWLTGGMHWAGNTFFFVSHSVIQTEENNQFLSPNLLFAICLALFIPIVWFLTKKIDSNLKNKVPKSSISSFLF